METFPKRRTITFEKTCFSENFIAVLKMNMNDYIILMDIVKANELKDFVIVS